jgi:hypothetical protein
LQETLTIRNFGPIKDVTLDLGKVNVFIGDQGTGKSTVAKIYMLVWNLIYFDIFNDEKVENSHDPFTAKFFNYLEKFDLIRYLKFDSFIQLNTSKFHFLYNNNKVESADPEKYKIKSEELEKGIHEGFLFNYIPAERVYTSTLSDALYGLLNLGTKLPDLFTRFGTKFQGVRKEKVIWDYIRILNASYAHINGIDYVVMNNGEKIFLTDASTGLQGTIPMLVVIDSVVDKIMKIGGSRTRNQSKIEHLLVVEEPELNLFPETQKKVIEYIIGNNFEVPTKIEISKEGIDDVEISEDFENKVFKNQLIITTHSPYTLTTLNNLMYAYQIGQKHKEEVSKIIEEKYWVNPEDVRCYMMKDGEAELIMEEDGLIDATFIDGVSNDLNNEYLRVNEVKLKDELGVS